MTFSETAALFFTVSAGVLALAAFAALFLSSRPAWLPRALTILEFVLLAASAVVVYSYACELFIFYYSASSYEIVRYSTGPQWVFWLRVASTLAPQLFWARRFRRHPLPIAIFSIVGTVLPP